MYFDNTVHFTFVKTKMQVSNIIRKSPVIRLNDVFLGSSRFYTYTLLLISTKEMQVLNKVNANHLHISLKNRNVYCLLLFFKVET
jgi:hypothetical protein